MDPKLSKLYKTWNKKLEKSGFKDIETGEKLKRFDSYWFHEEVDTFKYKTTREFFNKCEEFLESHEFQTKEHEHIFSMFCQGKTQEEIAKHVGLDRSWISKIMKNYLGKMRNE